MASGFTQTCANLLLEKLLRGTAGTFPTALYVGLFTTTPSDTGGGTEVTTGGIGGYARVGISVGGAGWVALAAGSTTNNGVINFGTSSGGTGATVTQFGIFDLPTSGTLLMWGDLTTPQTVASGNPYSFAANALTVAMV